jgi:hypothetical protein
MSDLIPYDKFTTGYTWREISAMVWSYSDDPATWHKGTAKRGKGTRGEYKNKLVGGRRHTILGLWRQIKQEMYDRYLAGLQQPADDVPF